jgi:hypothetical protein
VLHHKNVLVAVTDPSIGGTDNNNNNNNNDGASDRASSGKTTPGAYQTMPPKKKQDAEDLGDMRAARFGRVKNTLSMGFGACYYIVHRSARPTNHKLTQTASC